MYALCRNTDQNCLINVVCCIKIILDCTSHEWCDTRIHISWWCCSAYQQVSHTCNEVSCEFVWLSWLRADSSSVLSELTACFRLWAWLVAESTPCWLACTSLSSCSIWQHTFTAALITAMTAALAVSTDFCSVYNSLLQMYYQ